MKLPSDRAWAIFFCRTILGLIFFMAGIHKCFVMTPVVEVDGRERRVDGYMAQQAGQLKAAAKTGVKEFNLAFITSGGRFFIQVSTGWRCSWGCVQNPRCSTTRSAPRSTR